MLNASLLPIFCASWGCVCILSLSSTSSLPLSFDLLSSLASLLCILGLCVHLSFHLLHLSFLASFVRSGFITCAYMCARITQRSCVFLLSHLSHAGKKRVNSSAKTPIRQSGIELNNREKHLDKILFSKNCLQITLYC